MASIINASNTGVGGLISTADATGILSLQGAGNTQLTVNSTAVSIPTLAITSSLKGIGSQSAVTYLGADVSMPTNSTWYDGPNTGSIGANGETWMIVGCGLATCAGGAIYGEFAIHDGTNYLSLSGTVGAAAGWPAIGVPWWIGTLSGATTFTLKAVSNINTSVFRSTTIVYGNPKCTYITAVRLA